MDPKRGPLEAYGGFFRCITEELASSVFCCLRNRIEWEMCCHGALPGRFQPSVVMYPASFFWSKGPTFNLMWISFAVKGFPPPINTNLSST